MFKKHLYNIFVFAGILDQTCCFEFLKIAAFMQLPRKQKEYKPWKVQSMDTYRFLFRFHDGIVAWMS